MSTRTIEPIHIVLPDAEGGYYRFGELPGMIADAMYPECPDAADDDEDLLLMLRHAWDGVEAFKKDLQRAAELAAGEPGYLHVVENSASKRPLEWRMGAVLNAGLVHLDWLNEWGESRKPPLVFSTVAASTPQAATPAPVADSASNAPGWSLTKPKRFTGYTEPLYRLLAAAHFEGKPCPTARDVLEAWRIKTPAEIAKVLTDGVDYYDAKGDTKTADLEAIRKAIERRTSAR